MEWGRGPSLRRQLRGELATMRRRKRGADQVNKAVESFVRNCGRSTGEECGRSGGIASKSRLTGRCGDYGKLSCLLRAWDLNAGREGRRILRIDVRP